MKRFEVLPGWYPLLRSEALTRGTRTCVFAGTSLELSRGPEGSLRASDTEDGRPRTIADRAGWILIREGDGESEPDIEPLLPSPSAQMRLEGTVHASLADVGENILDTTHTSIVHAGYLRQPGARRPVQAILQSGPGWISATYPPGAAPGGWGARLLGAQRYTITDRFRAPGIAEVSYSEGTRPVFSARFWLTPRTGDETYVAATLAVPGTAPVAWIKLAALRLFFGRIFAEDRHILELIAQNTGAHGAAPLAFAPQDLLRPGINAILAGRDLTDMPALVRLRV